MKSLCAGRCFLLLLGLVLLVRDINGYRLPEAVKPEHYRLEITTQLGDNGTFAFEGKVWIKIICLEATSNITLHAKNLEIDNAEIKVHRILDQKQSAISRVSVKPEDDFLIIELTDTLEASQQYNVSIQFKAALTDSLTGYYLSSYMDKASGSKKYLAVTQFEPTDARSAFPCFDEPELKAQFGISLGREQAFSSVSNMPIIKTEPIEGKPGYFWDRFEDTVPMSTYLVAYMVSDFVFESSSSTSAKDVLFRTWSKKDSINQVQYANQIGPQILEYFENYFDIKYPLPKQDMVAIPDFSAGAMENWGLITYRESALLFKPNQSSATSQDGVASVIAHELAHQWFGNLVTMKWWTDLWLNEGFATYVGGLGVHHIHPEWNSLEENVVSNMVNVFSFDCLRTSHPVSVPIGHPNQISQIFDAISYQKGSAILRMMNLFLGEDTFRNGVSSYLKEHKYGNAEQDDLWHSLTVAAHEKSILPDSISVKMIMDTWTKQTGYPVVTVKRNYSDETAEISQQRFVTEMINDASSKECWRIPLTYTTEDEKDFNETLPKDWFNCDTPTKTIRSLGPADKWVIFNINMAGLFKVNYDTNNWNLLISALKSNKFGAISTLNRAQLIDDVLDLAWTGDQSYKTALNLVGYLQNEMEYSPWSTALKNLNRLKKMLQRKPAYDLFKKYIGTIMSPVYKRIGGLSTQPQTKRLDSIKLQTTISAWACKYNVGDCEELASKLFAKWQTEKNPDENNPIPADLRNVVYCTAIRNGGTVEWEFLWDRYKSTNVATVKSGMLSKLACSKDQEILKRYLSWTLNEKSGIRKQDMTTVFGAVAGNVVGYDIAKEFLFKNIAELHKLLRGTFAKLGRYVSNLAKQMTTQQEYEELQKFTSDSAEYLKKSGLSVNQSLETVQINIQWQQRNYENVIQLLNEETAPPVVLPSD